MGRRIKADIPNMYERRAYKRCCVSTRSDCFFLHFQPLVVSASNIQNINGNKKIGDKEIYTFMFCSHYLLLKLEFSLKSSFFTFIAEGFNILWCTWVKFNMRSMTTNLRLNFSYNVFLSVLGYVQMYVTYDGNFDKKNKTMECIMNDM